MSTYDTMRHFADSWGLVFMTVVFLIVVIRAATARRRDVEDAAAVPFKEYEPETAPAAPAEETR